MMRRNQHQTRIQCDDETSSGLSPKDEQGIIEATASIEAGNGPSFEDVFRELEDF
ncbi:MAG TPA: hypothetical protein PK156_04575 [Polyangium sp.]|nr:hypothetical protein [Polyangium sp.]